MRARPGGGPAARPARPRPGRRRRACGARRPGGTRARPSRRSGRPPRPVRSGSPHHRVSSAGRRSGWPSSASQARPRNGCSASSPAAPEPSALASPTRAEAGGVEQPGHPLAVAVAELERVGVGVVDPAEQDVDRLQAAERAQPDPTVADRQVAALDQVVAELLGQVGVLEVAGVAEAGREDDGAAVRPVLRGQRGQRGAQRREERVEAERRRGRGARRGRAGPGRCGSGGRSPRPTGRRSGRAAPATRRRWCARGRPRRRPGAAAAAAGWSGRATGTSSSRARPPAARRPPAGGARRRGRRGRRRAGGPAARSPRPAAPSPRP